LQSTLLRMNMYQVKKIFTDEEIVNLNGEFHKQPECLAHQDWNLFDVDKRQYPYKTWGAEIEKLNQFARDYTGKPDLQVHSHYFVKYSEESFTKLHRDDDSVVALTIVTVLETTDLVGGHTLMWNKYYKPARPRNKYAKRPSNQPHGPQKEDIIPVIVEHEDGESIIYDGKVLHGVTQVTQGTRTVMVSWYKNDNHST